MMQKRILLIMAPFRGYTTYIVEALENQGYVVDPIFITSKVVLSLCVKLPIIGRFLLGIILLYISFFKPQKYDVIIIIRGDRLPNFYYRYLHWANPQARFILYLWDHVGKFPRALKVLKYFDKVSSFERQDCEQYGFFYLPLFYIPEYERCVKSKKTKYMFSFVGMDYGQRKEILMKLEEQAKKQGFETYIRFPLLNAFDKEKRKDEYRQYYKAGIMSHNEIINLYEQSRCVVDIESDGQNGLTMRTFEVLASKTKLVTTNKNIKETPLYHENNVYILNRDDPQIDLAFLASPFKPQNCIEDYSINNWAKNLLK